MWPSHEAWRAPVGDFPPPWASAWGDDLFGLWADLTVNGATQRMRWIEPSGPEGFLMGAPKEEREAIKNWEIGRWADERESAQAKTAIEGGFWLADTPCTQFFWLTVMGDNPSYFSDQDFSDQRPVELVSWNDVERFVRKFAVNPGWGCEGRLCLPTERQWEYTARAGSTSAFWWGAEADSTMANWNKEHGETTAVKRYPANPWGLFDVHGNVWEWCADPWKQKLSSPDSTRSLDGRAVRGGSWFYHPDGARAAYRGWWPRGFRSQALGFRFALMTSSHQTPEPLR